MWLIDLAKILVIIGAIILLIWQRTHVIRFFRGVISPRWNNWILAGLWALTAILFVIAISQGGGEPLGLQALREIGRPGPESPIVKYYSESAKYFTTGSEKPLASAPLAPAPTWFWWKLWLFSFLVAIVYIPLAFWDEIVAAWHRAREIVEQRRERINLRPEPQPAPPQAPQPQPQPRAPRRRSRFMDRFLEYFSADMISEFIFEMFRRIIGERIFSRG